MIQTMKMRRALRGTTLAFAAVAAVAVAGPAYAAPGGHHASSAGQRTSYNNAHVLLTGGNARGVANCVQIAKTVIRHGGHSRTHVCDAYADAEAGSVTLQHVGVTVDQAGRGRGQANNATVELRGGDADAVSSCYQVLRGTGSGDDEQQCTSTAIAVGGNVSLNDVDITVIQG